MSLCPEKIINNSKQKKEKNISLLLQVSDVTQNIRKVGPELTLNEITSHFHSRSSAVEKVGPIHTL